MFITYYTNEFSSASKRMSVITCLNLTISFTVIVINVTFRHTPKIVWGQLTLPLTSVPLRRTNDQTRFSRWHRLLSHQCRIHRCPWMQLLEWLLRSSGRITMCFFDLCMIGRSLRATGLIGQCFSNIDDIGFTFIDIWAFNLSLYGVNLFVLSPVLPREFLPMCILVTLVTAV